VEGETEETFVNDILALHLRRYGFATVSARRLSNARQPKRRGGIQGWNTVRKVVLTPLSESRLHRHNAGGLPWASPNGRAGLAGSEYNGQVSLGLKGGDS
jgi:hypothetical protein